MIPIETFYKGYKFRSRLEARWAVFFDALGWEWQYEAEGFELPCGRYLPDFYFPEINAYAEVKPVELSETEYQKCIELKSQSGAEVFLLVGPPDFITYKNVAFYELDGSDDDVIFMAKGYKYYPYHWSSWDYNSQEDIERCFPETAQAIMASRSARFEFGQSGSTI